MMFIIFKKPSRQNEKFEFLVSYVGEFSANFYDFKTNLRLVPRIPEYYSYSVFTGQKARR